MKIALDLTALLPEPSGVDNYTLGLVRALAAIDRETRFILFVNAGDGERVTGAVGANFSVVPASLRLRIFRPVFQQAVLPAAALALGVDVVHSPAFITPMIRCRSRQVVTVHDMTSFSLPEFDTRLHRSWAYRRAVVVSIRRADVVVVPSEHVKSDLLRRVPGVAPGAVRVIPHGVGDEFGPEAGADAPAVLARLGIREPYLLHVGTLQPRKNLPALLESYADLVLRDGIEEHLVLAGQIGWDSGEVMRRVRMEPWRGRVHVLGFVAPADLPALYARAKAFVYPSVEEGFGLPPLEAMASGVPVVASDSSSMAEYLSGAAELVRVGDRQALQEALLRVLRDPSLRASLRERGYERAASFRWEEAARVTLTLYRELARDGSRPARSRGRSR